MAGNLVQELGRLLDYVSLVGAAIRLNSPYDPRYRANAQSEVDVMWLSDMLHDLDMLGRALQSGVVPRVESVCDQLIFKYERYRDEDGSWNCAGTFERWSGRVDIDAGIEIFRAIKAASVDIQVQATMEE